MQQPPVGERRERSSIRLERVVAASVFADRANTVHRAEGRRHHSLDDAQHGRKVVIQRHGEARQLGRWAGGGGAASIRFESTCLVSGRHARPATTHATAIVANVRSGEVKVSLMASRYGRQNMFLWPSRAPIDSRRRRSERRQVFSAPDTFNHPSLRSAGTSGSNAS